jgi:hypothetical protein
MCKGTKTQLTCGMQVSNRTVSVTWRCPNGQMKRGSLGWVHRGRRLGRCKWCGGYCEIYLPAMTYFPTPSPEQYRRR